jgi:hypothetical protein
MDCNPVRLHSSNGFLNPNGFEGGFKQSLLIDLSIFNGGDQPKIDPQGQNCDIFLVGE